MANLSVVAEDPDARWEPITIAGWYGGQQRVVEVLSATAVWYSTGLPAVALRWVLIRDPQEEFGTQALLCTDLDADPERIISWFVRRWQMEATFQEARQRLGFETQPNGLVRQEASDLLRCPGAGAQGIVGTGEFLRIARGDRHGKSPAGVLGTADRHGLLRGVNG